MTHDIPEFERRASNFGWLEDELWGWSAESGRGAVAGMSCPGGKVQHHESAAAWRVAAAAELAAIRGYGADVLLTLLHPDDDSERYTAVEELATAAGLEHLGGPSGLRDAPDSPAAGFAIADFATPSVLRLHHIARAADEAVRAGHVVVVHCSAGMGRTCSALAALVLLRARGTLAEEVDVSVEAAVGTAQRGPVIRGPEGGQWGALRAYALALARGEVS